MGFGLLWSALREAAADSADADALVEIAELAALWAEARSGAIAHTYMEEAATQYGRVVMLRRRLLEALSGGEGLLQNEYPSWLHMVKMGATTIWERWDSIFPDVQMNPDRMNSLNQYALGTVADWLHRTVAGLEPAAPGYRKIRFRPRPGGDLTHASARHVRNPPLVCTAQHRRTSAMIPIPVLLASACTGTHTVSVRRAVTAERPNAAIREGALRPEGSPCR